MIWANDRNDNKHIIYIYSNTHKINNNTNSDQQNCDVFDHYCILYLFIIIQNNRCYYY